MPQHGRPPERGHLRVAPQHVHLPEQRLLHASQMQALPGQMPMPNHALQVIITILNNPTEIQVGHTVTVLVAPGEAEDIAVVVTVGEAVVEVEVLAEVPEEAVDVVAEDNRISIDQKKDWSIENAPLSLATNFVLRDFF